MRQIVGRRQRALWLWTGLWLGLAIGRGAVLAQPIEPEHASADAGMPAVPAGDAGLPAEEGDGTQEPAVEPEPARGDVPVSSDVVVDASAAAPQPAAPPSKKRSQEAEAPLVVWATSSWSNALGPARCDASGIGETAIRVASTLAHSLRAAGIGVAATGALGDHPIIRYAAREHPQQLADLLADAGFSVLVLGLADLAGPLLREPLLTAALARRGVRIVASNLECGGQAFCEAWATAEDPLPIVERFGRRYAVFSVLPDDLSGRVEPAGGHRVETRPAGQALLDRTQEARAAGADLIVAAIDHGPDSSAPAELTKLLADLPPDLRPDLLLSPSAADQLLFMRPLDVQPAVVGTRPSVLTGMRVTKLPDAQDADVFARSVRLDDWDPGIAQQVQRLGEEYCRARAERLPGGHMRAPMTHDGFVEFAAQAARAVAAADLAVVDPKAYDPEFAIPRATQLERGQIERAVVLDASLVVADVTLDWLADLNRRLADGLRPLTLVGAGVDNGVPLVAGRIPVIGASYRIVTSSVLARSGRMPDAAWTLLRHRSASLRGALLRQLEVDAGSDPHTRLRDPQLARQWVLRADGQVQINLTAVDNPDGAYADPGLQVSGSRDVGVQLLINYDGDAPQFLFENRLQLAFDRNFVARTTSQDLILVQTTYTYRGLWPDILFYPHPFVEGDLETQFDKGDAARHPLLLRPEAGIRSMLSRVLSIKLSAGLEYRVEDPGTKIHPGVGAEIVLKPATIPLSQGALQVEGGVTYYWNSPGNIDQHSLRGQVIGAVQLFGPLQFTLTALGTLRKDPEIALGKAISLQAGLRLRFVDRTLSE
jgi:hypothetical protein